MNELGIMPLGKGKSILRKQRTVQVGEQAPDFTLIAQNGESVKLSDFRGHKNVVLYFYPKDDTRGCVVESSSFRDNFQAFQKVGAEIIGISSDSTASHVEFAEKYKLPFLLLSDEKNKVRELYGVPDTLGIIPGRVTFVIDKNGVVRHVFSSQFSPKSHVDEALQSLVCIAS